MYEESLPYRCPKCGKGANFATLRHLRDHLERQHSYFPAKKRSMSQSGRYSPLTERFRKETLELENQLAMAKQTELMHKGHWHPVSSASVVYSDGRRNSVENNNNSVQRAHTIRSYEKTINGRLHPRAPPAKPSSAYEEYQARLVSKPDPNVSNILTKATEQMLNLRQSSEQNWYQQNAEITQLREQLRLKDLQIGRANKELMKLTEESVKLRRELMDVEKNDGDTKESVRELKRQLDAKDQLIDLKQKEVEGLSSFLQNLSHEQTEAKERLETFTTQLVNRTQDAEVQLNTIKTELIRASMPLPETDPQYIDDLYVPDQPNNRPHSADGGAYYPAPAYPGPSAPVPGPSMYSPGEARYHSRRNRKKPSSDQPVSSVPDSGVALSYNSGPSNVDNTGRHGRRRLPPAPHHSPERKRSVDPVRLQASPSSYALHSNHADPLLKHSDAGPQWSKSRNLNNSSSGGRGGVPVGGGVKGGGRSQRGGVTNGGRAYTDSRRYPDEAGGQSSDMNRDFDNLSLSSSVSSTNNDNHYRTHDRVGGGRSWSWEGSVADMSAQLQKQQPRKAHSSSYIRGDVPVEEEDKLWFCVFLYLDAHTLGIVGQVCRAWCDISRHPALWRRVVLKDRPISSKFLQTMSKWCTQLQSLKLEGLQPWPKETMETEEHYKNTTWGCCEAGLELLLQTAGDGLRSLAIINCGHIITDRCLWLLSCHCQYVERVAYISAEDPAGPEVIYSLGAGCRNITTLILPPAFPNDKPHKFDNKCASLIGRCWSGLHVLNIGGVEVDVKGLTAIASHCQQLQLLELDHMAEITEVTASAMCKAGLKGLNTMDFTFTPVTPKALMQFYSSCTQLKQMNVHLGICDYFDNPTNADNIEHYASITATLKVPMKCNLKYCKTL